MSERYVGLAMNGQPIYVDSEMVIELVVSGRPPPTRHLHVHGLRERGMTLAQIGKLFGLSANRISQMEDEAKDWLIDCGLLR